MEVLEAEEGHMVVAVVATAAAATLLAEAATAVDTVVVVEVLSIVHTRLYGLGRGEDFGYL